MSDNRLAAYLEANPQMMGVLFALSLTLGQAGLVVANNIGTINGP